MWFRFSLLVVLCGLTTCAEILKYNGYKVYEVVPENVKQIDFLKTLSESEPTIDFWSLARSAGESSRVMISPEIHAKFEEILKENGFNFTLINSDLSKTLTANRSPIWRSNTQRPSFTKYLRFSEINAYLDFLAEKFPQTVKVETVGKSYEGRTIKTITISNGDKRPGKNVIFIDAGIHAREWIAPATAVYIINQLVENFKQNEHVLKNFDWKILPVVNPDGYEYTHSYDRFWRKTRQPNHGCYGTDGNRNFDFHWAEVGTSTSGCQDTYHGPKPFSEPETRIVRDIMHSISGRCKMYLSLHSFGSYILYPWGWTSSLPTTWKDLDQVAKAGANAIYRATGNQYKIGSSTNVLYPAAGGSDDYAFAKAGIPIAMTMELPAGGNGFDPRPSQIKPMGAETWTGVRAMAEEVDRKYA